MKIIQQLFYLLALGTSFMSISSLKAMTDDYERPNQVINALNPDNPHFDQFQESIKPFSLSELRKTKKILRMKQKPLTGSGNAEQEDAQKWARIYPELRQILTQRIDNRVTEVYRYIKDSAPEIHENITD